MSILLDMAYVILVKNSHFDVDIEYKHKQWQSMKIENRWYYPCTRITKLWIHFITYYKVQQQPDFQDAQRKLFLKEFGRRTAIFIKTDGCKSKYECRGAGSDSLKKSCRSNGYLNGGWNVTVHMGHKHGIMYVYNVCI